MNNNNIQYIQGQRPLCRSSVQGVPTQVRVSFLKKSSSQQKLHSFALPQLIRQNSIFYNKCTLCEQFYNKYQLESISKCRHIFCATCLHRYCIYKIDVMQDVNCPQEGCLQLLEPNNKIFEQLPQNTKDKYRRNMLWKQTINNPNLKLCPKENCQGFIDKSKAVYQCNRCRQRYCKECELIQHAGACDKNFQQNFRDWKRCPQCRMFIERIQGCNHMTCRCGHQFCFVCLENWQNSHYQCGSLMIANQIDDLPCWKRFLYGVLLIFFFPIVLVLYLVVWILAIGLGGIIGFISGPVMFYNNNPWAQNICCGILCPITLPIGAIVGIFFAFGYGIYMLGSGIAAVVRSLRLLWCECQLQINRNMGQLVIQE